MSSGLSSICLATPKTIIRHISNNFTTVFVFHSFSAPVKIRFFNLILNSIGSITIHLSDTDNHEFDTNVSSFILFLSRLPSNPPSHIVINICTKFERNYSRSCRFGLEKAYTQNSDLQCRIPIFLS